MIQYYLDLENQVKVINEQRLEYGQIQKIYSTSMFISFSIRTPGKTWHLYLGRGGGYEGIWLHESAPPSVLRRKDNFLEYLRRHISSCSLVNLELDKHDRIIRLNYQKFGELQSILFFWKARKLYFVHYYQDQPEGTFKLLLSWHGKSFIPNHDKLELVEYFNEVGRRTDMKHDLKSSKFTDIKELLEAEVKSANQLGFNSAPSFLQRKIQNIQADLDRAQQWNQLQQVLDEGQDLDMYELKVADQKIKFEGELNAYERRNLLFERIKKLKRGENILGKRLAETQELLDGKKQETRATSTLPMIKPVWGKEENKTDKPSQTQPAIPEDFKIFKFNDFSVGVGTSSTGNDQLRNKWGGKEDVWLHLDGQKSAHAIIKLHLGLTATPDMLNRAASILAYFSRFESDWIPIIYTSVKNLKGVSGSPGMVIYKKEKHLRCPKVDIAEWLKE